VLPSPTASPQRLMALQALPLPTIYCARAHSECALDRLIMRISLLPQNRRESYPSQGSTGCWAVVLWFRGSNMHWGQGEEKRDCPISHTTPATLLGGAYSGRLPPTYCRLSPALLFRGFWESSYEGTRSSCCGSCDSSAPRDGVRGYLSSVPTLCGHSAG
jgi:hypothetical protein